VHAFFLFFVHTFIFRLFERRAAPNGTGFLRKGVAHRGRTHMAPPPAAGGVGEAAELGKAGSPPAPPGAPSTSTSPAAVVGLTPSQYSLATAALLFTSLTSGATSMLLLLSSLKAGHSAWQTSLIFAAYQGASALAALGAGGLLASRGLRPVLVSAFLLQAAATAALVPLNARERTGPGDGVAWPLATATAYASAINAVSGVARVLARTGSKALPKLAMRAKGAGGDGRGGDGGGGGGRRGGRLLMLRTVLVTGGRTALKGAGSFLGGALAEHVRYPTACWLLAGATLPAAVVAAAALPGRAGVSPRVPLPTATAADARPSAAAGRRWWTAALALSRPVAVTTCAQALQNGAQFAWLQVPLTHLLTSRGAAFRFSRTAAGGAMAGVLMYEGLQQLATPAGLRALGQAPPRASPAVVGLWGWLAAAGAVPLILLASLSAAAGPGGVLGRDSPAGPAAAAFFGCLSLNVAPTQVFAALLSFTLQRVMHRGRIGRTAGLNTAAQAAGRAGGVLAAGLIYAGMTGDWRGHAHARHEAEESDLLGGRPNDAGAPVGPFGAVMGFTAVAAAAAAAVAWWGMPPAAVGEAVGVRCGPCLACCGAGEAGEEEGGGGKVAAVCVAVA